MTCRVLCFSPRHDLTLTDMPTEAVREVVDLWAAQSSELGARNRWVQIFENRGEAMGASNPHPHGQIWAGSALPDRAAREDAAQHRHHEQTGRRLLLDVAAQESGGVRVVDEDRRLAGARALLGRLAVRDAARGSAAGRATGRPRR